MSEHEHRYWLLPAGAVKCSCGDTRGVGPDRYCSSCGRRIEREEENHSWDLLEYGGDHWLHGHDRQKVGSLCRPCADIAQALFVERLVAATRQRLEGLAQGPTPAERGIALLERIAAALESTKRGLDPTAPEVP